MNTDQLTTTLDTLKPLAVVKNLAYYNKIISEHLKPEFFERNPLRLN